MTREWGQFVAGRCPACGSRGTLFVALGQHITCSLDKCPDPCLVADFLEQSEPQTHHVVEFKENGWHLEHTMRCRLEGLSNCLIHKAIERLEEPPQPPGRYRVDMVSGLLLYNVEAVS